MRWTVKMRCVHLSYASVRTHSRVVKKKCIARISRHSSRHLVEELRILIQNITGSYLRTAFELPHNCCLTMEPCKGPASDLQLGEDQHSILLLPASILKGQFLGPMCSPWENQIDPIIVTSWFHHLQLIIPRCGKNMWLWLSDQFHFLSKQSRHTSPGIRSNIVKHYLGKQLDTALSTQMFTSVEQSSELLKIMGFMGINNISSKQRKITSADSGLPSTFNLPWSFKLTETGAPK